MGDQTSSSDPETSPIDARAVATALSRHGIVVVACRDGGVLWSNEIAHELVLPITDPSGGPLPELSDRDLEARVAAAFRAPADLAGAAEAALADSATGRISVEFAANLALVVTTAVVERAADEDGMVALVSFPAAPRGDVEHAHIRRLEAMLDATADIITVVDLEGRVRYSNGAAGRVTGIEGTDANGQSMFDFIHPDDAEVAADAYARGIAAGEAIAPVELRIRFADGEWHDVEAEITTPIDLDGTAAYVVTLRDITDRLRREREAEASHRRLQSLVEDIDDVIVVLGPDLSVSYASPGIERMIDAPAYTNVGENAFNDMHPDDVAHVLSTLEDAASAPGRRARSRFRLHHDRHGWRWIEATVVNRVDDPAVGGFVCTMRDVTEQLDADAELRRLREQDREEMARLRAADRLKDDFLTTVSHELRTPLTSVRGFSALLESSGADMDPATRDQLVSRIAANAIEMEDMVEQLLDFSRLQADRVRVEVRPLDVAEQLDDLLDRLAHQLSQHEVVTAVAPGRVWADGRAFDHVLRNLITNAARYSAAGSRIEIRSERVGDEVAISVMDQGIGIAPDEQANIFRSFYQAAPGATGRRGVGVGLNVARRYAQLQSGHLRVDSEVGKGSTFTFTLPAAD